MARVLIIFDTQEGQTEKIASRMSELAVQAGHQPEAYDVDHLPKNLQIEPYDAVFVGGSIHMAKHSPRLEQFVLDHRDPLHEKLSGFFSVSLSAAGTKQQQREAEQFAQDFLQRTGWQPTHTQVFAGALLYREYNFLKRWIMRRLMRQTGGDSDASRNHEYTDWRTVQQFVHDVLKGLE